MRILIVDDEPLNRFLLLHMLAEQGYDDCHEAGSGEEGLTLAKALDPDIVLLDVIMPKMSGYEVAPQLKRLLPGLYLPIIFITSLEDKNSLAKCLEVGGDDFVSKPFDSVILGAKIKAHGRIRNLSQRIEQQNKELLYYRNAVEREHSIVEHIFSNAIINNTQAESFFDFLLQPATDFNGDLFLCEPSCSGGLYFLVGDFTGHGLASAIGALPVSRAFKAMAAKGLAVAEMAATINQTLLTLLPADMFFVVAIVEVDYSGRHFTVWNGGMPCMLLKNQGGQLVHKFEPQHMALGILEEHEFDDSCEHYEASYGDTLLVYSDGFMEIENAALGMLGEEGIEQWFVSQENLPAVKLASLAKAYLGDSEAKDDITIVLFTCQSISAPKVSEAPAYLPFAMTIHLLPNELRKEDTLIQVFELLSHQLGVDNMPADLFVVLTEMYNNAIEHGLLCLDSRMKESPEGFMAYYEGRERGLLELSEGELVISSKLDVGNKQLRVAVSNSGAGFDPSTLTTDDNVSYGRGIPMLRELCSSVSFADEGRTTSVVMSLLS
jgi:CheY-like chemotaxis protein/serine phosphatase RsbU (regulator of sigma subunit)